MKRSNAHYLRLGARRRGRVRAENGRFPGGRAQPAHHVQNPPENPLRLCGQSGRAHLIHEALRTARVQVTPRQPADFGRLGIKLFHQAAQVVHGRWGREYSTPIARRRERFSPTRFSLTGADSSDGTPVGRLVRRAAKRKTLYVRATCKTQLTG